MNNRYDTSIQNVSLHFFLFCLKLHFLWPQSLVFRYKRHLSCSPPYCPPATRSTSGFIPPAQSKWKHHLHGQASAASLRSPSNPPASPPPFSLSSSSQFLSVPQDNITTLLPPQKPNHFSSSKNTCKEARQESRFDGMEQKALVIRGLLC